MAFERKSFPIRSIVSPSCERSLIMRFRATLFLLALFVGVSVAYRTSPTWDGITEDRLRNSRVGQQTVTPNSMCCLQPALTPCNPQPCVPNPVNCPVGSQINDVCGSASCTTTTNTAYCNKPDLLYRYMGNQCTVTGSQACTSQTSQCTVTTAPKSILVIYACNASVTLCLTGQPNPACS
jgi:hypothetical protein